MRSTKEPFGLFTVVWVNCLFFAIPLFFWHINWVERMKFSKESVVTIWKPSWRLSYRKYRKMCVHAPDVKTTTTVAAAAVETNYCGILFRCLIWYSSIVIHTLWKSTGGNVQWFNAIAVSIQQMYSFKTVQIGRSFACVCVYREISKQKATTSLNHYLFEMHKIL